MEKQFYRTFIGLPVKVGEGVLEARRELMSSLSGERISWVDPERYHVTLRFLGDTEISAIKRIGRAIQEGVAIPQKSSTFLTQPASFGPRKKPRVIWIGFEQAMLFELLKGDVDRVLEDCGIPSVDQSFRAHLTIGRVRSIRNLNGFYDALEFMKDRFCEHVLLHRMVFYRSELSNGGPVYTPLCEMEFRD